MKTIFASICALALSACVSASAASVPADFSVTLERTACFGACPIYVVTITGDGHVTYNGRRFVRVTGEQHGLASAADVAHLSAMLDSAHFFNLQDAYTAHVTDLPSHRITVTRGGRTKSVVDYGGEMIGMPHAVSELEAQIDRVAHTEQWVAHPQNMANPPPD